MMKCLSVEKISGTYCKVILSCYHDAKSICGKENPVINLGEK